MQNIIVETERLCLRELTEADFSALSEILQDADVMYAYNGAFTDSETHAWLEKQLARYKKHGFGLWAVVLKETGDMIGQCGLTMQPYGDSELLEVGYLFQKKYWHKGYAAEAAIACRDYAFTVLGASEVYSIIRDTNIASQNVAKRNRMEIAARFVKHYRGEDMPHILYCVKNKTALQSAL